jgi:hypothetical protein
MSPEASELTKKSKVLDTKSMEDCPYCARKFLEKVAERHIKHCETSKSRPKPPPTKDELNEKQVKRR